MGCTGSSLPKKTILITQPLCVINSEVHLLAGLHLPKYKGIDLQQLYNDGTHEFFFTPNPVATACAVPTDTSINCFFVKPDNGSKLIVYDEGVVLRRLDKMRQYGFEEQNVMCSQDLFKQIGKEIDFVPNNKE
jgi:hypothetical protein